MKFQHESRLTRLRREERHHIRKNSKRRSKYGHSASHQQGNRKTPARRAREQAGFATLEAVSHETGLSVQYLRRLELHGNVPHITANKLSRLYQCSPQVFLYS